jgi:hypothetical protein
MCDQLTKNILAFVFILIFSACVCKYVGSWVHESRVKIRLFVYTCLITYTGFFLRYAKISHAACLCKNKLALNVKFARRACEPDLIDVVI